MKNIIFNQKVSLCLLVGVISGWLLGCSPKANNSAQIEFWTMQLKPNFTKYFLDLNTTFEAQNEIGTLKEIAFMAVVVEGFNAKKSTEFLISMNSSKWNIKTFRFRNEALEWLENEN